MRPVPEWFEPLTAAECEQFRALIAKAIGLPLQLPPGLDSQTPAKWLCELAAATLPHWRTMTARQVNSATAYYDPRQASYCGLDGKKI